jgi:hypothetical protein
MIGHRSTRPRRNASSELVPVSTHCRDTPARFAASRMVSTASPEKPLSVRICTGGICSKPIRRVHLGTRGVRIAAYQNASEATDAAEAKIRAPRLKPLEIDGNLKPPPRLGGILISRIRSDSTPSHERGSSPPGAASTRKSSRILFGVYFSKAVLLKCPRFVTSAWSHSAGHHTSPLKRILEITQPNRRPSSKSPLRTFGTRLERPGDGPHPNP